MGQAQATSTAGGKGMSGGAKAGLAVGAVQGVFSTASSLMSSGKKRRNAQLQQLGILGQQNDVLSNLLTTYNNIQNLQQETNQVTRLELTNLERQHLRTEAQVKAKKATSGVAGSSALAVFTNLMTQKMVTKGNIVDKGEAEQEQIGMSIHAASRQAQDEMAKLQTMLAQIQSEKESDLEIGLSAAGSLIGAGASGMSTGAGAYNVWNTGNSTGVKG